MAVGLLSAKHGSPIRTSLIWIESSAHCNDFWRKEGSLLSGNTNHWRSEGRSNAAMYLLETTDRKPTQLL